MKMPRSACTHRLSLVAKITKAAVRIHSIFFFVLIMLIKAFLLLFCSCQWKKPSKWFTTSNKLIISSFQISFWNCASSCKKKKKDLLNHSFVLAHMPKNVKLYHKNICWMYVHTIYQTPVIKPANRLQALKHNGISSSPQNSRSAVDYFPLGK